MVDNSNFLLKEIPKYHAISQQYDRIAFWKEQKQRCIEGYWCAGKWMPGTLYYYCNFHTIRFEDEGTSSRVIGRPWLRDIEWERAYIYEEAMGFSGFFKDMLFIFDLQVNKSFRCVSLPLHEILLFMLFLLRL